jgi:thymidylate synthase
MKPYHDALQHVLDNGVKKSDRTGIGTLSIFGMQQRYNLREGFPAVTTKKLAWRAVVSELLWFIEGSGDERRLAEILHGSRDSSLRTIWTDNAQADYWTPQAKYPGDLGRVYGVQWRRWERPRWESRVDQLAQLIEGIKKDPDGRRHILTAWNPGELHLMALPPCHIMSQFYVAH